MQPLNPTLYSLLCRRFGNVEIVNPGQAIRWRTVRRATLESKQRLSRQVDDSGEEMRLNCPFCHDTKRRLYINHRWAVFDPVTGTRNLWLAQCYNETSCLSSYERQKQLLDMLMSYVPKGRTFKVRAAVSEPIRQLEEVSPPGIIIPIGELANRKPNHRAVVYLEKRGFDCHQLERLYAVAYCQKSTRYSLAEDRIFIPVIHRGKMVGWQCRHIGDEVEGIPLKELEIPKYWSMPSFPRGRVGYNYDAAVRHRLVVIVEGPSDVWSTGPNALGLMGTTMSPRLRRRFVRDMGRLHGDQGIVVIMLDPPKPGQERSGYMKKLARHLEPAFRRRLVTVDLPIGTDPGSLERDVLWESIFEHARKLNVKLPSRRKLAEELG
jgi:hypothetical protein